jgi:predicted nucleic acid-binding protein
MPFVVDASLLAAWLLPDEASVGSEALFARLEEESLLAPDLLRHEMRSLLVNAVRRKRVAPDHIPWALRRLDQLPIRFAGAGDDRDVIALSERHGLTPYDAVYLWLAREESVALATLDRRLRAAAIAEGLIVLPEAP